MDDTIKTVLIDTSVPLVEVVDLVAQKVGLKNPGEFSLQEEVKGKCCVLTTIVLQSRYQSHR